MPTICMMMLQALNRLNAEVGASFGQRNSLKPTEVTRVLRPPMKSLKRMVSRNAARAPSSR